MCGLLYYLIIMRMGKEKEYFAMLNLAITQLKKCYFAHFTLDDSIILHLPSSNLVISNC